MVHPENLIKCGFCMEWLCSLFVYVKTAFVPGNWKKAGIVSVRQRRTYKTYFCSLKSLQNICTQEKNIVSFLTQKNTLVEQNDGNIWINVKLKITCVKRTISERSNTDMTINGMLSEWFSPKLRVRQGYVKPLWCLIYLCG